MNKPKIQVILGSIRKGRNGKKVADWFMNAIKDFDGAEVELVDLLDYPMPLFEDEVSPLMRGAGKNENPAVQKWLDKISEAHGYVFITAEYNHSVPSALKNAIDYGFAEWNDKVLGLVGYGAAAGGSRSIEHLRQIAAQLSMYDISDHIIIPNVWAAFNEQGELNEHADGNKALANSMIAKLAELASKLNTPVTA